jgi:glycosyltransferase involved in cell wall biosynthesis
MHDLRAAVLAVVDHVKSLWAGGAQPGVFIGSAGIRVVITHDFMETYGGAERVTAEIARAFPDASVWALLGRGRVATRMGVADRFHTVLPARQTLLEHYRLLTPAFPAIADRAAIEPADVVVSSSYAFAHRMGNAPVRVCYCHSPLRFAWSLTDAYADRMARGPARGAAFRGLAAWMRHADRKAARRVDSYLTQSPFTAGQIERFYGRRAEVIGAPVDCDLFRSAASPPEEWFLLCGRLIEPYKRVGLAIEAFRRTGLPLRIAGDGPAYSELRRIAPSNVEFLGHLGDAELVDMMQRCAAAVFPSRDDFGLIPVEVMACGRPVLAYGDGGALHTIREGTTGEFFAPQTVEALARALEEFDPSAYDPAAIRRHAEQWDSARFRERVVSAVARARE